MYVHIMTSGLLGHEGWSMLCNTINSYISFTANVSNLNGTGPIDYYVAYASPNFAIVPAGSKYFILNITTILDNRLEENELFRVYVVQPVIPDGTMVILTDVIIMNDDGEYIHYIHMYILFLECDKLTFIDNDYC